MLHQISKPNVTPNIVICQPPKYTSELQNIIESLKAVPVSRTNICLNHNKTGMTCIYPQGFSTLFQQDDID